MPASSPHVDTAALAGLAKFGNKIRARREALGLTTTVRIGDYPLLSLIAWQLDEDTEISEADALQLYERNWRHIDHAALLPPERLFLKHLTDTWGHGRLLVYYRCLILPKPFCGRTS